MLFKIDIGDPNSKKTFHIETESDLFIGKKIGDHISGNVIKEISGLKDFKFIITGATDNAGFPALAFVEGPSRKKVLLTRGKGLRRVRKRKKLKKPVKGLRLRKTIHGNTITEDIAQINLKVIKQGSKALEEIFGKPEEKPEAKPKEREEKSKEK